MNELNTEAGMPIEITLDAGVYYRCTCGKSSNLPFCDGGHLGSKHLPLRFELTQRKKIYICSCGKSANAPYCDKSCGVEITK